MDLGGQGERRGWRWQRADGYAMAALLVGMSIMAILMGAALPVWNKQAQREKEEEYLFRAYEYARAIRKFQAKAGPGVPAPSFDVLVQQRFLRRKYKDPITGEDFQPIYQTTTQQPGFGGGGNVNPGQPVLPGGNSPPPSGFGNSQTGAGSAGGSGFGGQAGGSDSAQQGGFGGAGSAGSGGSGVGSGGAPMQGAGIIGVVSKSKATSIKIYNGRTRYDQWAVTWQDVKLGKGLPPDLLQGLNAANNAAAAGAAGGFGQPIGGGAPGTNPFGGAGAGGAPNPFGGAGGAGPFGSPGGANPFGGGGAPNPFGTPGTNPFGGQPPVGPGGNPFGQPVQPGAGGAFGTGNTTFTPAYPPPATGGGTPIFGAPPRKQ